MTELNLARQQEPSRRFGGKSVVLTSLVLVFLGAPFPVYPQAEHTPQTARSDTATVRVRTRLVQVSVIVEDKTGRPVKGLGKDDFEIFDNGHRENIASFTETDFSRVGSEPASATERMPGTFSNREVQQNSTTSNATVVLVDGLNTDYEFMGTVRRQTLRFLATVEPEDRVALYSLTDKLVVMHDFTSDVTGLRDAVQRASAIEQKQGAKIDSYLLNGAGGSGASDEPSWLAWVAQSWYSYQETDKVEETIAAFKAIARHLTGLPGRKNLVWVSGTFPIRLGNQMGQGAYSIGTNLEHPDYRARVAEAVRALSDANVAVYPVDARGLMAPDPIRRAVFHKPDRPLQTELATMHELADNTGGVAVYNNNDLSGAIRRAIDDGRESYEITFYPTHNDWDGRFHEIRVKTIKPATHLRYRSGYFASREPSESDASGKSAIAELLSTSLEATGIPIEAHIERIEPNDSSIKLKISVPGRDVEFAHQDDRWTSSLQIAVAELSADGAVLASKSDKLAMRLSESSYSETKSRDLSFSVALEFKPGASDIRIVVRDANGGGIGSLSIPARDVVSPNRSQ